MSNYLPDSFYTRVMASIANIGAIEGGLEAWATSVNTSISELQESNGFSGSYNDLDNIPSSFPPSTHSHATSDITGFNTAVDARIQNIVGAAPAALDTLQEIAAQLALDESAVAALTATVSGKANASHTHPIADIVDLQTNLNARSNKAAFTALAALAAHGIANANNSLTTNYSALTVLADLVTAVNAGNVAHNDLATKFNTLLTKITAMEAAINNLKSAGGAA